jgi:hypothetical protein
VYLIDVIRLNQETALLDGEDVKEFSLDCSDMSADQLSKTIWDMIQWQLSLVGGFLYIRIFWVSCTVHDSSEIRLKMDLLYPHPE